MSGLTARGSRRGNTCQAGAARASAAMARRIAALPQSRATGQADAMAILMRRTLMRTSAPILQELETDVAAGGVARRCSQADPAQGAQQTYAIQWNESAAGWRALAAEVRSA